MAESIETAAKKIFDAYYNAYSRLGEMRYISADIRQFEYLNLDKYREFQRQLEADGLHYLDDIAFQSPDGKEKKSTKTVYRMMTGDDGAILGAYMQTDWGEAGQDTARFTSLFKNGFSVFRKRQASVNKHFTVMFRTKFSDGSYWVTSNSVRSMHNPRIEAIDGVTFPQETSLSTMVWAHRHRVGELLKNSRVRRSVIAVNSIDDVIRDENKINELIQAKRRSIGWVTEQELQAKMGWPPATTKLVYRKIQILAGLGENEAKNDPVV